MVEVDPIGRTLPVIGILAGALVFWLGTQSVSMVVWGGCSVSSACSSYTPPVLLPLWAIGAPVVAISVFLLVLSFRRPEEMRKGRL
jgi:hypothetical protein